MTPILRAVVAVHVASLLFPARHRRAACDLTDRTARTLAAMRTRKP